MENLKSTTIEQRTKIGNTSGIIGIFLNLFLFCTKLFAGILSSSISVIADAFNNLSDAGSSVVTYLGFKLANRPADREHPFGHGRYEYVAGLSISFIILIVGIELFKSSVDKIFNPEAESKITAISIGILILSIVIKMGMFIFNRILAKRIKSATLKAVSMDSLTDSIATFIVLAGLVVSLYTGLVIDGYLGIAVAFFIIFTGVNTFKESLSPLLGNPPTQEFVDEIKNTVLQEDMIVGIHDLMVHDYGPGRCIISLHAEIPCDEDILKAHDAIDLVEKTLQRKFNCIATIHMDPIASNDDYTVQLNETVNSKIQEIEKDFTIHDFRIVRGDTHTNVIFDLVIPYEFKQSEQSLKQAVKIKMREIDPKLIPVINIDRAYTND